MKLYLIYIICLPLVLGSIPDFFPKCKKSDPEIEKCILTGVEAIKPRLRDGIPEIHLPPLDPLKMDLLYINTSVSGATVKATVSNIVAHGGSNFNIEHLKLDLKDTYGAELKLTLPRLRVSADYNTQGSRLFLFSINGGGKFSGTFKNVVVEAKCVASPIIMDGVEYLQLDSMTTHVAIGDGDLKIQPDETTFTSRAASSFVSWNPSMVLQVLSPVIDETTAPIVKQYLNDVLATVPLNEFLVE